MEASSQLTKFNSAKDWHGYVRLITSTPACPIEHSLHLPLEVLVERPTYNPFEDFHDRETDALYPSVVVKPAVGSPAAQVSEYNRLREWFDQDPNARRFWLLHLLTSRLIGSANSRLGDQIYSAVLALCMSRRTVLTPLALPDGTVTYPGESIPSISVETLEVALRPDDPRRNYIAKVTQFLTGMNSTFLDGAEAKGEGADLANRVAMAIYRISLITALTLILAAFSSTQSLSDATPASA